MRSARYPASTPPSPITAQFRKPIALMLDRLQPRLSSMGLRKTPSANSRPMARVMIANAQARTTQRYGGRGVMAAVIARPSPAAGQEQRLDGPEIVFGIDPDGLVGGFEDAD